MLSQAALWENENIARITLKPLEYLNAVFDDEKVVAEAPALF